MTCTIQNIYLTRYKVYRSNKTSNKVFSKEKHTSTIASYANVLNTRMYLHAKDTIKYTSSHHHFPQVRDPSLVEYPRSIL